MGYGVWAHPLHGGRYGDDLLNRIPQSLNVVPPIQYLQKSKQQQTKSQTTAKHNQPYNHRQNKITNNTDKNIQTTHKQKHKQQQTTNRTDAAYVEVVQQGALEPAAEVVSLDRGFCMEDGERDCPLRDGCSLWLERDDESAGQALVLHHLVP